MSKSRNFIHRYCFSVLGIAALLALAVASNVLLRRAAWRVDLTEDHLYSLSAGTRHLLANLGTELDPGTKVTLRLYRSRGDNVLPVWLRTFAARVEDLLGEYVEAGGGRVTLEILDPTPDSDAEDAAGMDGISGQAMPNGSRFYLGLAVHCLDQTSALPFLSPMEEPKLEYDLTRAIYEATRTKKPEIGLISGLPIMGGAIAPYMAMKRRPKPPWIFMQELQRRFTIRDLGPAPTTIPAELAVLLVIHPKNWSPPVAYALDQFVLRGGKLLVALDPYSVSEARNNPEAMVGGGGMPGASDLAELLQPWGLVFTPEKVVADFDLAMRGQRQDGELESYPCVLGLRQFATGKGDVVMSTMNNLNLIYAGSFAGTPAPGLTMTTLATSSPNSQLLPRTMAEETGAALLKNFTADQQPKSLLVRLEGRFPSAFADGPPAPAAAPPKAGQSEAPTPEQLAAAIAAAAANHLGTATAAGTVVLIGDVDFLADEFCVSRQELLGQSVIRPFNDNLALIQGLVEFLAGGNDLISIRAKQIKDRPFTRIVKLQAEAQDRYLVEINKLEAQREQTQVQLNELQRSRTDGQAQQLTLSTEQREAVRRYEQQIAGANQKLKALRKELRRDIDRLQLHLQLLNLAGVPLLVIFCGLGVWGFKYRRAGRGRRIAR